jgi:glycosyltransferase involved in cell wall biosynthesis
MSPLRKLGICLIDGLREGLDNLDLIKEADLVIIHRDFPKNLDIFYSIVEKSKYYNKKIVFDIDDLIFELPNDHTDRRNFSFAEALLPIYHAIQESNLITVSTNNLKSYIKSINNNVIVLSNYIDDDIWQTKEINSTNNSELVIGYMGTRTHISDLEIISTVLTELLAEFSGKVTLKIWGLEAPLDLINNPYVIYDNKFNFCYPEFAQYFQQQSIDIAIAPLKYNLFNRCKSGIKFLEYSITGIAGVYSNIDPYSELVSDDNKNGVLVNSLYEWKTALRKLLEDREYRSKLAFEAQKMVKEAWILSVNINKWISSIEAGLYNSNRLNNKTKISRSIVEQNYEYATYLRGKISFLEQHVQQRDQTIAALEQHVQQRDQTIAALEQHVQQRDQTIAALEQHVQQRDQTIAALEQHVQQRDQTIAALEQHVKLLKQQLISKDELIESLQNEILKYVLSLSWKITRPLRLIRKIMGI